MAQSTLKDLQNRIFYTPGIFPCALKCLETNPLNVLMKSPLSLNHAEPEAVTVVDAGSSGAPAKVAKAGG